MKRGILAGLGNGAPDVSSTISAVKDGHYQLSLGALTGAGMFVTTVVRHEQPAMNASVVLVCLLLWYNFSFTLEL